MRTVVNRLVALVVGLALAGLGVMVAVESVSNWTGNGFLWIPGRRWLSVVETTSWSAMSVMVISAAVGAVGLVVLVLEVAPGRKRLVALPSNDGARWFLLRRSTEGHLQRRIATDLPAEAVKVRLDPHGDHWVLKVRAASAPSSALALATAGRSALADLHAPEASIVQVATSRAKSVQMSTAEASTAEVSTAEASTAQVGGEGESQVAVG